MFNISTKGDYGLLLLSCIAEKMAKGQKFVSLKEIAQEKRLSADYLSQIVMPLKKAGLLISKEGRIGGYRLSKPAGKITLMEILEVLEGPVALVACCANKKNAGKKIKCSREKTCRVKSTWQIAKIMLIQFLRTKTLADTLSSRL